MSERSKILYYYHLAFILDCFGCNSGLINYLDDKAFLTKHFQSTCWRPRNERLRMFSALLSAVLQITVLGTYISTLRGGWVFVFWNCTGWVLYIRKLQHYVINWDWSKYTFVLKLFSPVFYCIASHLKGKLTKALVSVYCSWIISWWNTGWPYCHMSPSYYQ